MSRLLGIAARLRAMLFGRGADWRAYEEFRFHLDMETAKNERLGMSADEARRRAVAAFGIPDGHRDDLRDGRWPLPDDVLRDVRLAARALRATPGFTVAAIASLALGLALTASAVAVVNAYLGRSLPYPHAERLYHVMYAPPGPVEPHGVARIDWRALGDVVEDAVTASSESYYLGDDPGAPTVRGLRVSPGFLAGLGVRTAIGRPLGADDFRTGGTRAALIGDALWRDRFGGDPHVVGRDVRVEIEGRDGRFETLHVVGVLAPGFWYGRDSDAAVDVVTPLLTPRQTYVVRLRDGVSPRTAERRLTEAARGVATWIPPTWPGVTLESMHERYVGALRPTLVAIAVAAGLVLAITCVNVAVLTLLRAMRSQRDVAVRVVLGAGRADLLRLYLMEIGMLCAAALAAAVALTAALLRVLAPLLATELGKPAPRGTAAVAIDWTVLGVVGAIGLAIALTLAAVPALLPWQRRLGETLRGAGRAGTDGLVMRRARSTLIALEIAGSLALVAGCGLMIRSAVGMMQADLGFRAAGLVRVSLVLRDAAYPDAAAFERFYRALGTELAARGAGTPAFAGWPPYEEAPTQTVERDGRVGDGLASGAVAVGDGYFAALGIPLRRGRAFTDDDRVASEPVAIVSETLARRLWPDGDALGRRVRAFEPQQPGAGPVAWRTVVGVAADVRQTYDDRDASDVYVPYFQDAPGRYAAFYLRTTQPPASVVRTVRAAVASLDPHAVVRGVRRVDELDRRLASARFMSSMLTGFAAFTALLAMLGIYGVVAYAAQQRGREMAIRQAIGATRPAVIALFLRDGGRVLAAGLALGIGAAAGVARVLEHQLYGVRPFDVATLAGACLVMTAAGVVAVWWSASRGVGRDPVAVLNDA